MHRLILLLLLLAACARPAADDEEQLADSTSAPVRAVALTFDDLPGVFLDTSTATARAANERLVAALVAESAHATGFVNEIKLQGRVERAALLTYWLDAGLDLGNHTFSHLNLNETPLEPFQDDVLRGEVITRALMRPHGRAPRFFRHPYLRTGLDLAKRAAFEQFLTSAGYHVAPVTIDNYDYVFAAAYDRELRERDKGDAGRILRTYVQYMDTVFGYYEAQSRTLFGREPSQVLLLHVNNLNADAIDELLLMMKRRGYAIVPLDVALQDDIYRMPDTYVGAAGITWLHRWAMTRGVEGSAFAGEPEVPEWIAGPPLRRPE